MKTNASTDGNDFVQFVPSETVETLGYEWVRPKGRWRWNDELYAGVVAVETTAGWVALARIERWRCGAQAGIRRVMVKADELNTADA
jgi:hypothetical protein